MQSNLLIKQSHIEFFAEAGFYQPLKKYLVEKVGNFEIWSKNYALFL